MATRATKNERGDVTIEVVEKHGPVITTMVNIGDEAVDVVQIHKNLTPNARRATVETRYTIGGIPNVELAKRIGQVCADHFNAHFLNGEPRPVSANGKSRDWTAEEIMQREG